MYPIRHIFSVSPIQLYVVGYSVKQTSSFKNMQHHHSYLANSIFVLFLCWVLVTSKADQICIFLLSVLLKGVFSMITDGCPSYDQINQQSVLMSPDTSSSLCHRLLYFSVLIQITALCPSKEPISWSVLLCIVWCRKQHKD